MAALIGQIYQFATLSSDERKCVVAEITAGTDLHWPRHRTLYILPLCKSFASLPLTPEETELLNEINCRFETIKTVTDLDTCLMFWQITKSPEYWRIIQRHANTMYSPVYRQANVILTNYSK